MNDQHENPLEGVEFTAGQDAVEEARRVERKAKRAPDGETPAESSDPNSPPGDVEDLPAWIREHKRPDVALEPRYLCQAAVLQAEEPSAFARLKSALRGAGVGITDWSKFVNDARRAMAEEAAREDAKRRAEQREASKLAAQEAQRAEQERAKSETPEVLQAHYWEHTLNTLDTAAEGMPSGDIYVSEPGRLYVELADKRGTRRADIMPGASAYIAEELLVYPSPEAQPARKFVLSVCPRGATEPYTAEVEPAEFERRLPATYLGSVATLAPGGEVPGRWRFVAGRAGASRPSVSVFGFTGRHRVNGSWVYLHSGGALDASGPRSDVRVQADERTRRFCLEPPLAANTLTAALRKTISLCFGLKPEFLAVPLFAGVFAAALGLNRWVLYLTARSESGKSTAAALAQRFFGKGMHREALPVSVDGASQAGLASVLAAVGDAIVTLDDYLPNARKEAMDALVDSAVRSVFEGRGSTKSRRDGKAREALRTRCSMIVTGEVLAPGHSLVNRCIVVELPPKNECSDFGPSSEVETFASSGEASAVTSSFLRWSLGREAPALVEASRFPGCSPRTVGMLQQLGTGAREFLCFAREHEAITEAQRSELQARWFATLAQVGQQQASIQAPEKPEVQALQALRSAIHARAVYLTGPGGQKPKGISPGLCGYIGKGEFTDSQGNTQEKWDNPNGAPRVGMVEAKPGTVLLEPGTTLSVVQKAIAGQGGRFPFSTPQQLAKCWAEAGFLVDSEPGRGHTKRFKDGPNRGDWIWLRPEVLWPSEEPAPATPGKPTPAPAPPASKPALVRRAV